MCNMREKGKIYELKAKEFLEKKDYKILETNFYCKLGEIDIVANDKNVLVFIEVKARKNVKYGHPREFVTISKQRKIIKTAKYYIKKKRCFELQCRFDVIEVITNIGQINHIENAFWVE